MLNRKITLGVKIAIPIIIITSIFVLTLITINYQRVKQINEETIDNLIERKITEITINISRVTIRAIGMSSMCSNLDFVKKAYSDFYENRDLQTSSKIIEKEMKKINSSLRQNTGRNVKIHYHLPPARSFIRGWSAKRGDDISDFRKTVLKVSETHKPLGGIEAGRGGFVIRGIVPIFGSNKKYYGSVETIYPISIMVKKAKTLENEEFAIFMDTKLLNVTTNFLEKESSNVKTENTVIGDFILLDKTGKSLNIKNLSPEHLKMGLKEKTTFKVGHMQYAIFPISNYSGIAQGVGVVQIDTTVEDEIIKKTRMIAFTIGISLPIILILIILFLINKIISKPIDKAVQVINKLSNKDIRTKIIDKRNDEIGVLYDAINNISDNFREILTGLQETATTIISASINLHKTAFSMTDSSIAQASTTEEISSSMEEMLATVESNAQRAEITGETANSSAKEIRLNNELFTQAIESVHEITKRIAIISEIASKTDILSINAAIEASHAGDAGKGFAVVAQEIRKLADKSNEAATEIEERSIKSQEISKTAGEKLSQLVPEISESADLIDGIVVASKELVTSIELINDSVLQLVDISNTNTIISEELSASSEELSAQAEMLNEAVSVFKL